MYPLTTSLTKSKPKAVTLFIGAYYRPKLASLFKEPWRVYVRAVSNETIFCFFVFTFDLGVLS